MTVDDVAGVTKLAAATVRKYVLHKTIPFVKIGAAVRFKPSEIESWINRKARSEVRMAGREEPGIKAGELFSPEKPEDVKHGE
jgi:excisionase family DNA binding protein